MAQRRNKVGGRTFDGPRLREIRQAAGIHMATLATAMGCNYDHLRIAEYGDRRLSIEMCHRAANALTKLTGRTVSIDEFTTPVPEGQAA